MHRVINYPILNISIVYLNMRPDFLLRRWRYVNYLLTYVVFKVIVAVLLTVADDVQYKVRAANEARCLRDCNTGRRLCTRTVHRSA